MRSSSTCWSCAHMWVHECTHSSASTGPHVLCNSCENTTPLVRAWVSSATQGSEGGHEMLSLQPGVLVWDSFVLSVLRDGKPPYSIFCPMEKNSFIFPGMKALDIEYCRGRAHCCGRNGTLKSSHVPSLDVLSCRTAKCSDAAAEMCTFLLVTRLRRPASYS